jgi:hypothetical protein
MLCGHYSCVPLWQPILVVVLLLTLFAGVGIAVAWWVNR